MSISVPKVSIIMCVYNGEKYLREAVDSILGQTFTDFQFIVVDDGSTDTTGEILLEYSIADLRVVFAQNEENIGLTRSLNKGLRMATGQYIGRQDADDISMPERIARQVGFLDAHPEVGLVGVQAYVIDEKNRVMRRLAVPVGDLDIRWRMLFSNSFVHGGVMFRSSLLHEVGYYDERILYAQDYDYWVRVSEKCMVANLTQTLVCWRLVPTCITRTNWVQQQASAIGTSQRQIGRWAHELGSRGAASWTSQSLNVISKLGRRQFEDLTSNLTADTVQNYLSFAAGFSAAHRAQDHRGLKIDRVLRRAVRQDLVAAVGYCSLVSRRNAGAMLMTLLRRDTLTLFSPSAWRVLAKFIVRSGWPPWFVHGLAWVRSKVLTARYFSGI